MATPVSQFRPWRLISTFLAITAGLYALVLFTPGANTPKLGIDLQGGTRITLTAHTADNSAPSRTSMQLARDILERRVNGSGIAGAQVQIDGTSQLIVTVPGTQDLTNLTRSAQLNFRPVDSSLPQSVVTPTPSVQGTGTETSTGGSVIGSTSVESGATTSASVAPTSAAPTGAGASQGLRGDAPAVRTDPTTTGDTSTLSAQTSAVGSASTGTADSSSDPSGTATSPAAPATVSFPSTSNPANPTQPAGTGADAWATWKTDITTAMQQGLTCAQLAPYEGLDDTTKPLIACDQDGTSMYVMDPAIIKGDQIDTATSQLSPTEGWVVLLKFKSDGFNTWAAYTTANIGKQVAFALDGKVVVAPAIQGAITTDTQITGNFTQSEAVDLANSLKFGALPLAFERSSSDSVTAELGLSYLHAGLIAGGIGLLLVIIYCLVYYRLLGLITIMSLLLSFGLVYAVMVLLGRWAGLSLDMAGIAGLIIAIGITADSFVVYFERIKDEVREGRTFRSAVPRGWVRAKRTILSADAVSFLAAFILYILAVGEVKGFALTLGLSTVLDLVVVFLVTHPLVALASGAKVFTSPRWSGLGAVANAGARQRAEIGTVTAGASPMSTPAETIVAPAPKSGHTASFLARLTTGTGAFDILGRRKIFYLVSTVLVLLSIVLIVVRGFNFGIDFAGGTRIQLPASNSITTDQVAQVVSQASGVTDPTIQTVGTGASATIQVRVSTLSADQVVAVKQALSQQFSIPLDQISDSAVSETWGGEISRQAIIALIVFLAAAGAFLWLRYERRVAVGALVAVLHDVIITAGLYSLVGFEVTPATVIGLLAILGFSLYDTVVVYDKVQENTKGLTSLLRRNFTEAANLAINQTLMRSINTTIIALLPVAGLLVAGVAILGSGTLKDLALVQLIGMIVSGYSSVFLAVPIAVDLRNRDASIKAHAARVAAKRKADGLLVDADGDPIGHVPGWEPRAKVEAGTPRPVAAGRPAAAGSLTEQFEQLRGSGPARPQPGARPRPGARPTGKTSRPTGKRGR